MKHEDGKADTDIREELIEHADKLARALKQCGHNEVKKAVDYFIRHQKEPDAYKRLLKFLSLDPPKYSRTVVSDWHNIGQKLKEKETTLTKYSPDQIAFILGWAARLLRYYKQRAGNRSNGKA
jgi:hypothetical protein